MNELTIFPKFTSLFLVLVASLNLLSCGSFQGVSYFSSDGIYNSKVQIRNERPVPITKNNSNYYLNYFKDAAQGTISENEIYFTDTDNYTSEENYLDDSNYVESSQIPWGEKSTQTEIIIIDRSPNFMWGLSNFAFRTSPFWNNYYSAPFRFGYGLNGTSLMDPFINTYYGGYSGNWGYDTFFSPFSYYSGYRFGYGFGWNRWSRWNHYGIGNNNYNHISDYGKDHSSTIARVKSGRGEKNYEGSKRSEKIQAQNAKNKNSSNSIVSSSRVNFGRGFNSLRKTHLFTNQRDNTLSDKAFGNSKTARPSFGSTSGIIGLSDSSRYNRTLSKSLQGNSKVRLNQSLYPNLGARNNTKTSSPRRSINSIVPSSSKKSLGRTKISKRSSSYSKPASRSYNNNSTQRNYNSSTNLRSSSPARSYRSGNTTSRSLNSVSRRNSSGGVRN